MKYSIHNFVKIFFLFLIVIQSELAAAQIQKKIEVNVCLTGQLLKAIPKYFQAIKDGIEKESLGKFKIKSDNYFYDENKESIKISTKKMIHSNCALIIGYSNTNDLIRASEVEGFEFIPIITLYGLRTSEIMGKRNVHFLQPDPNIFSKSIKAIVDLNYPGKKIKDARILVVTSIDRYGLKSIRDDLIAIFKSESIDFEVTNVVESTFRSKNVKDYIYRNKLYNYDIIILLNRVIISGLFSDEYAKRNSDTLIVGNPNFGSNALPAFLYFSKLSPNRVFFPRYKSLLDPDTKNYIKDYNSQFKSKPMVISILASDSVKFIKSHLDELEMYDHLRLEQLRLHFIKVIENINLKKEKEIRKKIKINILRIRNRKYEFFKYIFL